MRERRGENGFCVYVGVRVNENWCGKGSTNRQVRRDHTMYDRTVIEVKVDVI